MSIFSQPLTSFLNSLFSTTTRFSSVLHFYSFLSHTYTYNTLKWFLSCYSTTHFVLIWSVFYWNDDNRRLAHAMMPCTKKKVGHDDEIERIYEMGTHKNVLLICEQNACLIQLLKKTWTLSNCRWVVSCWREK